MSYALIQNDGLISDEITPAIVPWWSFTKTIIAAAVLVLVRDKILSLDETCPGKPYTLRQLLQHEAGLSDYGNLKDYHVSVEAGMSPWSVEEMQSRVNASNSAAAPRRNWAYSNIGYLHVRQLIEHGLDESLDSALNRLVFRPLGLHRTRVANLPSDLSDVVMGNIRNYHPGWVYHGLVVGPLTEAVVALRELMTGSLLPDHLLAEMLKIRTLGGPIAGRPWTSPGYGLGVMAGGTDNKLSVVGHTGGGPGSAIAVYHTKEPVPTTCAAFATSDEGVDVERIVVSKLAL
ncbi:serine hydrolase domain-containing protein [uncultured Oxalicibacterium sp.]|uniref:serine hydrolase domain-containing protein n=1 Tax=uncultured Oxalicibacterium sp. TaxID=1168540 RepID=UPI0025CDB712|nr:serine hydrolase domain-containing protein [uncultured Oxalicibacterium sp.]